MTIDINNKMIDWIKDIVYQILEKENLTAKEWQLGKIDEVLSEYRLKVFINGSTVSEIVPCNPNVKFFNGEFVWVIFINGNPRDKFVPFKRSIGTEFTTLDSNIPISQSGGDMRMSVYDKNTNGKVDISEDSEKLGGYSPSHYATMNDIDNKLEVEVGNIQPTKLCLWIDTSN